MPRLPEFARLDSFWYERTRTVSSTPVAYNPERDWKSCYYDALDTHSGGRLSGATVTGSADLVRRALADPRVDINNMAGGMTSLMHACVFYDPTKKTEYTEIVRLLLMDPRVDVNLIAR